MESEIPYCIYNQCKNEARWVVGHLSGTDLLYCDEHLYWGMLVMELFRVSQCEEEKRKGGRELDVVLSQRNIVIFKSKAELLIKKRDGELECLKSL